MIAPASEPIIPLGLRTTPSPDIRLTASPPMMEPARPAASASTPVNTLRRPAHDELRGGPDEPAEQEDAEDEHDGSIFGAPAVETSEKSRSPPVSKKSRPRVMWGGKARAWHRSCCAIICASVR